MPSRVPLSEVNRPLLRQLVHSRRSDPKYEAYILEVREGPAINGNTNAAVGNSIPQPWVTIRDCGKRNQSVGLPVFVCDALLKHLMTCSVSDERHSEGSEGGSLCATPEYYNDHQQSSPTHASGDANSPTSGADSANASPTKNTPPPQSKSYQLCQLKPIRIVCEATGCMLEVANRDPVAKRAASADEQEQIVPVDPSRRWLVSAPSELKQVAVSGEQNTDNGSGGATKRKQPWEVRGFVELHESLLSHMLIFLADVATRYRTINQVPEVRSLYSASGGRRFFFDLRDTPWGKRLHISQVTNLHRNVIGIPLEALVNFRTRLDHFIQDLKLDDQPIVLSETRITGTDQRRSPRYESAEATDDRTGGRRGGPDGGRAEASVGNAPRARERRRPRAGRFSGGRGARTSNREHADNENFGEENSKHQVSSGSGGARVDRFGTHGYWTGGPRSRRFPRRTRNSRSFNNDRKELQDEQGEKTESGTSQPTDNSAEQPPALSEPVVHVVEASA